MELDIEEKDGKFVVETREDRKTILALLKKYMWNTGAEAGFQEGHPYVGSPKLVYSSDNPAEDLEEAVESVKQDLEEFKSEIQ
ncbi:MAG: hypothetical protein SVV03_00685 [Candidatus Nanohaloarchaea archaeon]|nr:hypothetical protein [Candidatus Nanohaloarchaea archaeon]